MIARCSYMMDQEARFRTQLCQDRVHASYDHREGSGLTLWIFFEVHQRGRFRPQRRSVSDAYHCEIADSNFKVKFGECRSKGSNSLRE